MLFKKKKNNLFYKKQTSTHYLTNYKHTHTNTHTSYLINKKKIYFQNPLFDKLYTNTHTSHFFLKKPSKIKNKYHFTKKIIDF